MSLAARAYIVSPRALAPTPAAALASALSAPTGLAPRLGTVTLPAGYVDWTCALGPGWYASVLRVHAPDALAAAHAALASGLPSASTQGARPPWRSWDEVFMPGDAARLYPLAHSLAGDVLAAHADDPELLVVLPRSRDRLAAFTTFDAAVAWFIGASDAWERVRRPWFEPDRTPASLTIPFAPSKVDAVLDALAALAPDHDDGGDPPLTFGFQDAGAVVQIVAASRVEVRADQGHEAFGADLAARLAALT